MLIANNENNNINNINKLNNNTNNNHYNNDKVYITNSIDSDNIENIV